MSENVQKELDIHYYKNKFAFRDFNDIIDFNLVKEIMWGFLNFANTGVGYQSSIIDLNGNIDDINYEGSFKFYGDMAHTMHNKVCDLYSDKTDGTRPNCCKFDKNHFKKIIKDNNKDIHNYVCWLGFKEYACPLVVDGKIRALILTGQMIPNDDPYAIEKIKKSIRNCNEQIILQSEEWEGLEPLDPELIEELVKTLDIELERLHDRHHAFNENKLKKSLNEVQKTLQNIIEKLFVHEYSRIADEIMSDSVEILSCLNPESHEDWWCDCGKLINSFIQIVNLDSVHYFMRHGSRYRKEWPFERDSKISHSIRCRYILETISNNKIVQLTSDDEKFAALLDNLTPLFDEKQLQLLKEGKIYLYRYDVSSRESSTSNFFLIILSPDTTRKALNLIREFFKLIASHIAIVNQISSIHSSRETFKRKVGLVAHSLRTPLQSIYFTLDKFSREFSGGKIQEFDELISNAKERIFNADEDMTYLLEKAKKVHEKFNIITLVEKCYEKLKAYAESRECKLHLDNPDNIECQVYGDRIYIGIAITNVIENAIKYSWGGPRIEYDVIIALKIIDNYIVISVYNYGIGIPDEKIDELETQTEPGYRANVTDKTSRGGTGWGFPIAVKNLKENEGWLEIESTPADNESRSEKEKYHRYKTYVHIYLPRIL
ncbi:MAG: PocR ligand-binding domain-containing protein [Spirochaetales bacterium]|nr:PocR ligand-binding domain-containing protein [Spirochaetales bacterium]